MIYMQIKKYIGINTYLYQRFSFGKYLPILNKLLL